jgi:S-DNA-T family DNA segregation ATPase FtsK/SpoIIIE
MEKMPADVYELPSDKKYSLAILQGKASGQIFPITKCRITIGRADSDILLDDPECSRQHAVLEIRGARITLTDMESTNGTFVDGKRIDQTDMDRNSEFRIGEHVMMLIITDRE